MPNRLLAIDLDGTLAKPNAPISDSVLSFIKALELNGVLIALVSGKPAMYLSGLVRQLGLKKPILVGENGAEIYCSGTFPPRKTLTREPASPCAHAQIASHLTSKFGAKIWLQPNTVNLTIFPYDPQDIDVLCDEIRRYIADTLKCDKCGSSIYVHSDSVELVPIGIDKGTALRTIQELENIVKAETISIGDAPNDIAMLNESGHAFLISAEEYSSHIVNVGSIEDAFRKIQSLWGIQIDQEAKLSRKEWLIKEYEQLSADWRHRDAMLWAVPATSIAVTGALVAILGVKEIEITSGVGITQLLLATIFHFTALVKITKDHFFQLGTEGRLKRLCGDEVDAIHQGDQAEQTNPRKVVAKDHDLPEIMGKWLYKRIAKLSAFNVFFRVQASLAGITTALLFFSLWLRYTKEVAPLF